MNTGNEIKIISSNQVLIRSLKKQLALLNTNVVNVTLVDVITGLELSNIAVIRDIVNQADSIVILLGNMTKENYIKSNLYFSELINYKNVGYLHTQKINEIVSEYNYLKSGNKLQNNELISEARSRQLDLVMSGFKNKLAQFRKDPNKYKEIFNSFRIAGLTGTNEEISNKIDNWPNKA